MQLSPLDLDCEVATDRDRLEAIRAVVAGPVEASNISGLFRLLGDPHRLRVLSALIESGELRVSSIASVVDASEQKVSQALRLLRSAGLVTSRREGRSILYRISDPQVRLILGLSREQARSTGGLAPLGFVEVIATAAAKGAEMEVSDHADAVAGMGLVGDRNSYRTGRQVSVQSRSELDVAQERLGSPIRSELTRRNITIDQGELPNEPGSRILMGEVELEVHSEAPPCVVMTEAFGPDAIDALTGLSGVHCLVVSTGEIVLGDPVRLLTTDQSDTEGPL